jgi:PEP-CTERM motif
MNARCVGLLAVLTIFVASPLSAQSYDNGPTNGTVYAWTINFGFVVSDTFTIGSGDALSELNFAAWLFPGDALESAEVSITSSEFGGTTYFDSTVNFTQSGCVTNQLAFNVCNETGILTDAPSLNAGTYWLNLQNAVIPNGDPVYWDENFGPSMASENSIGTIPSESFTLNSCVDGKSSPGCGPPPTSPEPSSFLLFGSGMLGMLSAARRFVR